MCLLYLSYKSHTKYPLIIAANRDEFYERSSAPACFWPDNPGVIGGRDLQGGGTWFGMTKGGRIAAVTNFRDLASVKPDGPSRGMLVRDFLCGTMPPEDYLRELRQCCSEYSGFNIIAGTVDSLYYFSNMSDSIVRIPPGAHCVSNNFLNVPWPKVARSKALIDGLIAGCDDPVPEEIFGVLGDGSRPDDRLLPDTGVGLEWERILSSIFIGTEVYGTRSSTIVLIDRERNVTFIERAYGQGGEAGETLTYRFSLE